MLGGECVAGRWFAVARFVSLRTDDYVALRYEFGVFSSPCFSVPDDPERIVS